MKHTLTLTGSIAALIAAMQAFEEATAGSGQTGNAPSTPTGTGTQAPTPPPSAPSSVVPMPNAPTPPTAPTSTDSEDEDGDDSDGTGVDSVGLPWDDRIHSSSKKKGKDGTWNKRRGGPTGPSRDDIERELRASRSSGTPMPPVSAPPPPMPPVSAPTMPVAPPPPLPVPASAAPTPVTPEPAEEMDFASLMSQIGPKLGEGEGQINKEYLVGLCQGQGINSITDLAVQPEKIGVVVAQLRADNRW